MVKRSTGARIGALTGPARSPSPGSTNSQNDDPSVVTITIEPDGTGSIVTIVHEKIWKSYVEKVEMGWSNMLRTIDALLRA